MRRGFTMIELVAVLTIIGLAAGAVALNVRGATQRSRWEEVVDRIAEADASARDTCRMQGRRSMLLIDLPTGRIERADAEGRPLDSRTYQLPEGYRFVRACLAGEETLTGQLSLGVSTRGLGASYALLLEGQGKRQWLVFSGLTGQLTLMESDNAVRAILDS